MSESHPGGGAAVESNPYLDKDLTECPKCNRDDFKSNRGMRAHHAKTHGESLSYVTLVCEICDCNFKVEPYEQDKRDYCSHECRGESIRNRVVLTCEWCGDEYEKRLSNADRSRYCSTDCMYLGNSEERKKQTKLSCEQCGDVFSVALCRRNEASFCSRECHTLAQTNFENMGERKCYTCDERIIVKRPRLNAERVFCSNKCVGIANRGEGNPSWNGGLPQPQYGDNWQIQRRKALKRDNYECQICGKGRDELGKNPDVHHVIPVRMFDNCEKANRLDNLICLCRKHHSSWEGIPVKPITQ